jgi:hypothetical protein
MWVSLAYAWSYERCAEPELVGRGSLSETGLFTDPAVMPFRPRHELWSDGASKQRWIALPPGLPIDTADMDAWVFPVGTRLWKEFSVDGVRIETRLLEKVGHEPGDWLAVSYVWDETGTDALATPDGLRDARGTGHDVPAARECMGCHGGTSSRVLGFSAVQLPSETLLSLAEQGALTRAPEAPYELPGDTLTANVLGRLHANCGHCHNQHRPVQDGPRCYNPQRRFDLSLRTDQLSSPEVTPLYQTALGRARELYQLARRGRMPALGTELVDPQLIELLEAWVPTVTP